MNDKAGIDKDNQVFTCDNCNERFFIEEMIPEDGFAYCRSCFNKLKEKERE